MQIEIGDYISLRFGEKSFIGILNTPGWNGLEVRLNDHACFWAFVDMGDNDFKIMVFTDEGEFKNWLKIQPKKIKIIQSQGIGYQKEEK